MNHKEKIYKYSDNGRRENLSQYEYDAIQPQPVTDYALRMIEDTSKAVLSQSKEE